MARERARRVRRGDRRRSNTPSTLGFQGRQGLGAAPARARPRIAGFRRRILGRLDVDGRASAAQPPASVAPQLRQRSTTTPRTRVVDGPPEATEATPPRMGRLIGQNWRPLAPQPRAQSSQGHDRLGSIGRARRGRDMRAPGRHAHHHRLLLGPTAGRERSRVPASPSSPCTRRTVGSKTSTTWPSRGRHLHNQIIFNCGEMQPVTFVTLAAPATSNSEARRRSHTTSTQPGRSINEMRPSLRCRGRRRGPP